MFAHWPEGVGDVFAKGPINTTENYPPKEESFELNVLNQEEEKEEEKEEEINFGGNLDNYFDGKYHKAWNNGLLFNDALGPEIECSNPKFIKYPMKKTVQSNHKISGENNVCRQKLVLFAW